MTCFPVFVPHGIGHRFGRQHYNGFQNGTDYEDSPIRLILKSVVVLAQMMTDAVPHHLDQYNISVF